MSTCESCKHWREPGADAEESARMWETTTTYPHHAREMREKFAEAQRARARLEREHGWGYCRLIKCYDRVPEGLLAYLDGDDEGYADLQTRPSFGCTLHEARS